MATDMDVTTATFGTANLLLASGDPITDDTGSAWGGQVAQNTGWLYYQPRNLNTRYVQVTDPTGFRVGYAYFPAGTYSLYAALGINVGAWGYGTLFFDGTEIVKAATNGVHTGSLCGWTVGTGAWIAMTGSSGDANVTAAFACRFGSYAP
jgi:hypothetical protein